MTTKHINLFVHLALLMTTAYCLEVIGNKQYKEIYPMWKRQMREPLRFGKRQEDKTNYFKNSNENANDAFLDNGISFQK
ncbi:unnamed protein product [Meloidogyne enterolobii]|uniref:Uncharacterized protein n=1 Tax=Meloidogyne enterolobii TaxID=390850 RepID=A0ACB1A5R8_MELEN